MRRRGSTHGARCPQALPPRLPAQPHFALNTHSQGTISSRARCFCWGLPVFFLPSPPPLVLASSAALLARLAACFAPTCVAEGEGAGMRAFQGGGGGTPLLMAMAGHRCRLGSRRSGRLAAEGLECASVSTPLTRDSPF